MKPLLEDARLLVPTIVTALVIAIGSTLVISLSGEGAAGGGQPASVPEPASGAPQNGLVRVAIKDFKYVPETVTVTAGSKVEWTNEDAAPHTATADGLQTGDLGKGESRVLTLKEPGTYAYVCEFHAFMTGTVVVK